MESGKQTKTKQNPDSWIRTTDWLVVAEAEGVLGWGDMMQTKGIKKFPVLK